VEGSHAFYSFSGVCWQSTSAANAGRGGWPAPWRSPARRAGRDEDEDPLLVFIQNESVCGLDCVGVGLDLGRALGCRGGLLVGCHGQVS
jgi:hypothetical protein